MSFLDLKTYRKILHILNNLHIVFFTFSTANTKNCKKILLKHHFMLIKLYKQIVLQKIFSLN